MSDGSAASTPHTKAWPASPELVKELAPIYARLLAIGSARIWIEYSARDGVGGFKIEAFNTAGKLVTGRVDGALYAEVTGFFMHIVERRHPGWSDGPGGHGHLEWRLDANRLRHRHRQRAVIVEKFDHWGL